MMRIERKGEKREGRKMEKKEDEMRKIRERKSGLRRKKILKIEDKSNLKGNDREGIEK